MRVIKHRGQIALAMMLSATLAAATACAGDSDKKGSGGGSVTRSP